LESGDVIKLFDLDFTLQSRIGKGNCGEVWLVESNFGNPLAIKKTISNVKDASDSQERFVREASSLLDLEVHPHIVSCIGVEKNENELIIVMEYIPDGSLRDLFRSSLGLNIKTSLTIAIQIAIGLAYLHKNRLIHRDIKPENILISKRVSNNDIISINCKISDLGLLKEKNPIPKSNLYLEDQEYKYQVGTEGYMSPEQNLKVDRDVDENSDIFSYGVLLGELFTRFLPYDDDYKVNDQFNRSLDKLIEQYGEKASMLVDLIQNCLQFLPEDRWYEAKTKNNFAGFETIVHSLKNIYREITGLEYVETSNTLNNFLFAKNEPHRVYYFKANSFFHLNNNEKAIEYYNKSIAYKPDNVISFIGKGAIFTRQGRYDEAIAEYDKAMMIAPYDEEIYYNKSITLDKFGKVFEALTEVGNALRINPNHPKSNYHRGLLLLKIAEIQSYFDKSIYEEAIDCFKKKLNSDPHSLDTLLNMATCLEKIGKNTEELGCLHKILDIDPNNTKALNNMCSLLAQSDDITEAIKRINVAISRRPNDPIYHQMRGILFGKKEDYKKAIECFDKAIDLDPTIPAFYHNKSIALLFQGKHKEAKEYLDKYNEKSAKQTLEEKMKYTKTVLK
jgi:serine/threonine protein kinase